jgi:hypothetical protein
MSCKRVIERNITIKEFEEESENPHKFFIITYTHVGFDENDELPDVRMKKESQRKDVIRAIIDSPNTFSPELLLVELVDDG